MNDALEKFLRIAATASKSNAYTCESIDRCIAQHPMQKLTQEDLDAFNTVLSLPKLDTKIVEKVMNDVLQKFFGDHSMEEIFKAKVRMFGIFAWCIHSYIISIFTVAV